MREHENKAHGGGVSGPPHADGGAVPGRVRTDRLGRAHVERARSFSPEDCPVPARRRHGPVETGWEDADDESSRRRVLDDAMAGPSPVTAPDPEDRDRVLMTWTVREPGAVSVLLDANGLFAAGGVEALTMTHWRALTCGPAPGRCRRTGARATASRRGGAEALHHGAVWTGAPPASPSCVRPGRTRAPRARSPDPSGRPARWRRGRMPRRPPGRGRRGSAAPVRDPRGAVDGCMSYRCRCARTPAAAVP